MDDIFVNFSTALLAKEIGFNLNCFHCYSKDGHILEYDYIISRGSYSEDLIAELQSCESISIYGIDYNELGDVSAPTQSLLQKWLRETHNICVIVKKVRSVDNTFGYVWNMFEYFESRISEKYSTYEEALEIGLQFALNELKQK